MLRLPIIKHEAKQIFRDVPTHVKIEPHQPHPHLVTKALKHEGPHIGDKIHAQLQVQTYLILSLEYVRILDEWPIFIRVEERASALSSNADKNEIEHLIVFQLIPNNTSLFYP